MMSEPGPLPRCARCLLPPSLPGSDFNDRGVCAWCQCGFPAYEPLGEERLEAALRRQQDFCASADCLVGLSGGKDSAFALLQLTRRFGLRAEAFTYVHDAMSEFALENARSVCRALDVKQHLVSLPNRVHVASFIAFFEAWVESGDPFAAATSCAACKHLHLLGARLAHQRHIPLVVWAHCPLENPPVNGARPGDGAGTVYRGVRGALPHAWRSFRTDPGYRRAFLAHASTCLLGWLCVRPETPFLRLRYPDVRHLRFYDYYPWRRDEIASALRRHTPWAAPSSLPGDWHSDCRLHPLKEYMSQRRYGAASDDAHLSNQIRHGLLTREQAWEELVRIKAHQVEEIPHVLSLLGLPHLTPRLDLSCLHIANDREQEVGSRE